MFVPGQPYRRSCRFFYISRQKGQRLNQAEDSAVSLKNKKLIAPLAHYIQLFMRLIKYAMPGSASLREHNLSGRRIIVLCIKQPYPVLFQARHQQQGIMKKDLMAAGLFPAGDPFKNMHIFIIPAVYHNRAVMIVGCIHEPAVLQDIAGSMSFLQNFYFIFNLSIFKPEKAGSRFSLFFHGKTKMAFAAGNPLGILCFIEQLRFCQFPALRVKSKAVHTLAVI